MSEIILTAGRSVSPTRLGRCFGLLVCTVMALSVAGCPSFEVAPATPKLVSIKGRGVSSTTADPNIAEFRFDSPTFAWDANTMTQTVTEHIGTTVSFTVPYPTSIELEINGRPLTDSAQPLSRNYEYNGSLVNPGENPVTWVVAIRTPFDVPYAEDKGGQVAYVLSIVDVSGSNRSQPLQIYYRQPQAYVPRIPPGAVSSYTTNPPSTPRPTGPCPNGAQEQAFSICWRKPGESPYTASTTACSYSQAVDLLKNSFPDSTDSPGKCP